MDPVVALQSYCSFLTFWSLALVVFHEYTHQYVHLLALSAIVAIGGFYVSHISPRAYYIVYNRQGDEIVYTAPWTYIIDILFHAAPFIFVVLKYSAYYGAPIDSFHTWQIANTLLLLAVYLASFDVKAKYHLTDTDLQRLTGIGAAVILTVIGLSLAKKDVSQE